MFAKRGQNAASGAAILIVIITLLIVLYVLFLPPEDRADLLGEQVAVPQNGIPGPNVGVNDVPPNFNGQETVLAETPGRVDYTALNELEIPLNSFTLFSTVNAQVIEEFNPFYIKNGVGDETTQNLTFSIPNIYNTDNVVLSFATKKHEGVLNINLNGQRIYNFDISSSNPEPIKIKRDLLSTENSLEFSVSSVGMRFWTTNEYSFEDVKIIGNVADTSRQESENTFFLSEKQGESVERAIMRFNPECNPNNVGKLTIKLNGRLVFSGIPDCGNPNFVEFAPNMVFIGKNKVDFSTGGGSYLIDLIKVRLEFTDNEIPVYYFDVDSRYFSRNIDSPDPECGRIDGFCPEFCDEDVDYDCCFETYTTPFWCVAQTANDDDRCVGFVTEDNLNRCSTNYVGRNGDVSDDGEDKCGDNEDNECPAGCTPDLDKDCCYDQPGDQYWCEFMPTNGLDFRCMNSVSLGQCDICPTGYDAEGRSPVCRPSEEGFEIDQLKGQYGVILSMKFTEDYQRKEADVYINGHLTRLQTNGVVYQRDISHLVEPGTNSVEIVPFSVLNIREIKVEIVD